MKEQVWVGMPTEVPRINDYVNMYLIQQELNNYISIVRLRLNVGDLQDWKLYISVNSRCTDKIGIAKRIAKFPSDKEFQISISIAIPDESKASFGIPSVHDGVYFPANEKYSYVLEPNYSNYDNLYDYILSSAKLAIEYALLKGYKCNGKIIKLEPTSTRP